MVSTNPVPPLLTGGHNLQSVVPSVPGDMAFQGHFLAPPVGPEPLSADNTKKVNRQEGQLAFGIDWLDITVHPQKLIEYTGSKVVDHILLDRPKNALMDRSLFAVSTAMGCDVRDWQYLDYGVAGYRQAMIGPGEAKLFFDRKGAEHFHFVLTGKACSMISDVAMMSLLRYFASVEAVATRIDIKMDDYTKSVSPIQVRDALMAGHGVTRAQKGLMISQFHIGKGVRRVHSKLEKELQDLVDHYGGDCMYLGSEKSRQKLRVYDKEAQSRGEIKANRWELQMRDEAAETMMAQMLEHRSPKGWGKLMVSRLIAFVDFRDSTKAMNSTAVTRDRPRLRWFTALVGMISKGMAYPPVLPRTVQQLLGWIDQSVGVALAVGFRFWEGDLTELREIVRRGEDRFRPKHLAMLASAG